MFLKIPEGFQQKKISSCPETLLLPNIWISVLLRPTEGLGVGEDGEGEAAPHCSRQVGADTLVSPRVVGEHRPRAALYRDIGILRIWVLWIY